ncbi:hypothetical protein JOD96_003277 [Flavobacterium sp. 1355]|nr:hypothetical protein [Flavobacterium sp. 1355]
MIQSVLFNSELILLDFFSAYGLTTILFLILSLFIKKNFLKKVDVHSNHFISFIGIVYLIVWIIATIVELYFREEESRNYLLNRMFGKYWFGFWLQPLIWFSITQLLRFKTIQKNILFRLIFSFLLIISIEKMVIIFTSFHRDYLPSSWTMYNDSGIYPSNIFLVLLMKISIYLLSVRIYFAISQKIKELKARKANLQ